MKIPLPSSLKLLLIMTPISICLGTLCFAQVGVNGLKLDPTFLNLH
ncbi:hypothetical protein BH11BAC1_BH11BAC1_27180 [soil metagenome]